jgi:hypothetical protein
MKKRFLLPIVAAALVGLMAMFAASAQALPAYTMTCSGCHTLDSSVTVTATRVALGTTSAKYDITVTSPYALQGWAVFNGSTRVAGSSGATATVTVPVGKKYTIFGAGGTFVGDGSGLHVYNSITVTPPVTIRTVNVKLVKVAKGPKSPKAVLTSKSNGSKHAGVVTKKTGWYWAKFKVAVGSYKLTVTAKKFTFKPRTVVVK